MSLNGSGVYVVNSAGQPVVANTLITSAAFNAFTADIATALSTAIFKDGQQTVTANIPFAGFKLTGVGAATARTDAATLASIQDGTGVYVATVGGTVDAITLTPSPAITAYAAGQYFSFISSGANTGATTVTISGIGGGAKSITKNGTTALAAGDIPSGKLIGIIYDGTRFQLVGHGDATFLKLSGGTLTGNLLFSADNTLDVGAAGATRPRDLFLGRNLTMGGDLSVSTSDSRTNTVDVPATITSQTSGSPAAGIGTGILLQAESGDEAPSDFGQLQVAASDVNAGSEDTYFEMLLRVAGAALTSCYRFAATGAFNAIFTHANTAARTYTLPDRSGTIGITLGTAQATTSGTAITFTSIPAGTRRITMTFVGVSVDAATNLLIQLGDAGGDETSGYVSVSGRAGTASNTASTAGFIITSGNAAGSIYHGVIDFILQDAADFRWGGDGLLAESSSTEAFMSAGTKALSAELDRISLTTVSGTGNFDAGEVNITYEM